MNVFAARESDVFALKPVVLLCSCLFSSTTFADENSLELSAVAVTGNPLGATTDTLVVPVSVISGRELTLRRESTLGDTLNGIPGVSATHFGPNASRPVIRGLDAERVSIMQNGIGVLDASSLSFDHAVTIDPLVIEQIDVVRGPAALLYGGSAMGGVVNAIDHRIPKEPLEGVAGRAEASIGGADSRNNLAAVVDVGNGRFAIHADAYTRKSSETDLDGYAVSRRKNRADGTPRINKGKLVNSDADSEGGALGAALTLEHGHVGLSYSAFRNNYGTVAEESVRADMQSDRWEFSSEFKELGKLIDRVKIKMAHTDYQHQEIENGEVGTIFKNRGLEGAFEFGHDKLGLLEGVVGLQFQNTRFSALGDEAFVPGVNTQKQALYVYEEVPLDTFKLTFGGRVERVDVDSRNSDKFGSAQNNRFHPSSYALGGLYQFNSNWSLATNLSHNERAPSYFELYANGPHLATGQYEVGNADFGKERSNGVDMQLRWKEGRNSFNVGAYYTRFSRFLGLLESGNTRDLDGEMNPIDLDDDGVADGSGEDILPEARFSAFAATFRGVEMDGKFAVSDNVELTVRGDYVRANNRDYGDNLPRITPLRLGAGLRYQKNAFGFRLDVLRAFAQNRYASNELKTDGYTDFSAVVTYKLPTRMNIELFGKGYNLLNQEMRDHASFLKDISPAGERSMVFGVRADF